MVPRTQMSDLDKAFYNLTVHQRNVAWEEAALLRKELAALKEENADYEKLVALLGKRLTDTANALKGGPPPDSIHGWHDLPILAERFRGVLNDLNAYPCVYDGACSDNDGSYRCSPCMARKAIEAKVTDEDFKKIEEADEKLVDGIKAELEKWKKKAYWRGQALDDERTTALHRHARAFKQGAERMQQAILDILQADNVAPETIAEIVQLDYPEFDLEGL